MAAAVISGGAEGHSGSALYFLGSMFNHACSPSVSVTFPDNDSRCVHAFVWPLLCLRLL